MTPVTSLTDTLRRLWAVDSFAYSLRVFIALSSIMAGCWVLDEMDRVMPLLLGTIACAIAETDDSWRGRLRALVVTLLCFAVAAFSVQALYPRPWWFALGLVLATFGLTMLGAISKRYQAIAYGTLILAVYTTIGIDHQGGVVQVLWLEPALFLTGAAWYGLLSVLWCALFLFQPVQQNLAQLYRVLGDYLRLKASLFEPVRGVDVELRRLSLAQHNSQVVTALNIAKESIFSRLDAQRSSRMDRYLHLYFVAQDVHERASSSHYPYGPLVDAFFHSDVLFRCQRLLALQGRACERLARAIQLRQPFDKGGESQQAMADLQASIDFLRVQDRPQWRDLLHSLGALARNLGRLYAQLAGAGQPALEPSLAQTDSSLFDRSPRSWRDALARVRGQLTPTSPVFRHAVRLSVALAVGYALLHLVHTSQDYWILLTTLFVCQPSFGATRQRVVQRVLGTMVGLVVGWAVLDLFPSLLVQAMLAVVAGVVFFTVRTSRYALATGSMTLLVLLCFNQVGDSYDLITPRMVDTVIGSGIAVLAVFFILPDWQGRRIHTLAAQAIGNHSRYLREIVQQYQSGQRDDLAYRLARRNAHNADAALSTALSNMMKEPGFVRREGSGGLHFLVLSHTLLSYLSALGAHRQQLGEDASNPTILQAAEHITRTLDAVSTSLAQHSALPPVPDDAKSTEQALVDALEQLAAGRDSAHGLVLAQFALICRQLGALRQQANGLLKLKPA